MSFGRPPLIIVDVTSPLVVRRRRQAAITVTVRGHPTPRVTWHIGHNRKPISTGAGDRCFQCSDDGLGRHTLLVSSVTGVLDNGVWVVATNSVGQDTCLIDVKTYRVLRSLESFGEDPLYSDYTLLRGCRLRRRIYDPDDVISGLVGALTSRDSAYASLPRDLYDGRSRKESNNNNNIGQWRKRRTRSDPSTRRDERNLSSLVRVDSGLADESYTVSSASPSLTDDIRVELTVPPAPVISLDAAQYVAMNINRDASYVAGTGKEINSKEHLSKNGSRTCDQRVDYVCRPPKHPSKRKKKKVPTATLR